MESINPFTGNRIATYQEHSPHDVQNSIELLQNSFLSWKLKPLSDRCLLNEKMAVLLEKNKQILAELITSEMGKPITESLAEVEKCAWLCRHYSLPQSLGIGPISIKTEAFSSKIYFEPLGVIFAIMPWNFPFWQVFRFAIPCITAGNTVILKHAPNVTGCALAIQELFNQVQTEFELFKVTIIQAERSEEIISHPNVKGVTITGSERAGKAVAGLAGIHLKKVVLELGGSDPFIVFADADLTKCVASAVKSRMLNAGQVCIAAKRFIVHESLYQRFMDEMKNSIQQLKIGNPMDSTTLIGPMARPDLVDEIEKKVTDSVKSGAKVVFGGKRHPDYASIYIPTLLTDIHDDMPVFCDETFGPVAVVISFKTDDEAIQIANNTRFGLGASIWTRDIEKAKKISSSIESGSVFINSLVKSDPRLPFGGTKNSGFGRELTAFGVHEFMNIKTEWIE